MAGSDLHSKTLPQLRALAKARGLSGTTGLRKADLIARLIEAGEESPGPSPAGAVETEEHLAPPTTVSSTFGSRDDTPPTVEPIHVAGGEPSTTHVADDDPNAYADMNGRVQTTNGEADTDDVLQVTMRPKDDRGRGRDRREGRHDASRGRLGGRGRRGRGPEPVAPADRRAERPDRPDRDGNGRVDARGDRRGAERTEGRQETRVETRPEGRETRPEGRETRPEGRETRPEGREARPEGRETRPEGREARPEGRETRSEGRETRSEGRETRPEGREARSEGRSVDRRSTPDDGRHDVSGALEVLPEGRGFLRRQGYSPSANDVYVSESQIRRFGLRTGDYVVGEARPPRDGTSERYHSLLRIDTVNGDDPERCRDRVDFESLTPIFPEERFRLETDRARLSTRIMDIIAPIGKGQRGLIVSPPKAGKTTVLKDISHALITNHPEVMLMVLLVDERPEEVTDISRAVGDGGEVVASTFDQVPENHMRAADFTLERAKRLVEHGKDVVILLDSLTRLARASNLTVTPSGRTLSGGLDPAALYKPKRFLGAARKAEEGGSLTIMATVLVETGSRMDEMIYEEFKATGNMEFTLDRGLAERRIWPAIDVRRSSTRHHELLYTPDELKQTSLLIRALASLEAEDATRTLLRGLKQTPSNDRFLMAANELLRREAASAT